MSANNIYADLLSQLQSSMSSSDFKNNESSESCDNIPAISAKVWNDNDIVSYFGYPFSPIPLDKSVHLAKMWWRLYTGKHGSCLPERLEAVVSCMALHLVDPTKRQTYVVDMAMQGTDLTSNEEIETVLKRAEQNDLESQQYTDYFQEVAESDFVPFESTPETEKEVAAANKWFSTLTPRNQVAFTALIATICLTTCTRKPSEVSKYIVKSALIDFVKLYRRQPITGIQIPAPNEKFLEEVSDSFKRGSKNLQMVLSRFLSVYKIAKEKLETKPIVGLLERLILNKTSGNGLKVVYLAMDAAKALNVETKELLTVIDVDKWKEEFESWIVDTQNILNFFDVVLANVLWPWCRVLNPMQHLELRTSQNKLLILVFACIIWPNGDEPGWSICFLKQVNTVEYYNKIRKILNLVLDIRNALKIEC